EVAPCAMEHGARKITSRNTGRSSLGCKRNRCPIRARAAGAVLLVRPGRNRIEWSGRKRARRGASAGAGATREGIANVGHPRAQAASFLGVGARSDKANTYVN